MARDADLEHGWWRERLRRLVTDELGVVGAGHDVSDGAVPPVPPVPIGDALQPVEALPVEFDFNCDRLGAGGL